MLRVQQACHHAIRHMMLICLSWPLQENPNQNMPIIRNMTQGDTIHIPQGVLHFSHNPYCQPAAFLANLGECDPGTQTIWNSLMRVPSYILNAATGLTEDTINQLKTLPLVTAPGTGGEECLRRCGLDFNTVGVASSHTRASSPGCKLPT